MKSILKVVVTLVIALTITILISNAIVDNISRSLIKKEDSYKKHVGKTHIINKDTLIIIDYSIISKRFTLSNGIEVSYELINKKNNNGNNN